MARIPRFEREEDYKRKKRQRQLLQASGGLALASGAMRVPGAARVIRRQLAAGPTRGIVRNKPLKALAARADAWTPRSNAAAAVAGTTGALSSLNFAQQQKKEIQREEKALGIAKGLRLTGRRGRVRQSESLAQIAKRAKESPISPEAYRAAMDVTNRGWAGNVSRNAQFAHDAVLPAYYRRNARSMRRNAVASASSLAGGGAGALASQRIKNPKLRALSAVGSGAAGLTGGAHFYRQAGAARGRARSNAVSMAAIRARGHQRALDSKVSG